MSGIKDELEYLAFCKKLLDCAGELKQGYQNLSPENREKLRSQATDLLRTSGLLELLGPDFKLN